MYFHLMQFSVTTKVIGFSGYTATAHHFAMPAPRG